MKIERQIKIQLLLSFLILIITITPGYSYQDTKSETVNLVLSFDGEDSGGDSRFVLATPFDLDVNDSGDIFVCDESMVKIFDSNGKGKKIIGGPGIGPGEFGPGALMMLRLSRKGFLNVSENRSVYSVFTPEFEFIKRVKSNIDEIYKRQFKERTVSQRGLISSYSIDPNHHFIELYYYFNENNVMREKHFLVYENESGLNDIFEWDILYYIDKKRNLIRRREPFPDEVIYEMADDNTLIYIHSKHGTESANKNGKYVLNSLSLNSNVVRRIEIDYELFEIPESERDTGLERARNNDAGGGIINRAESIKFYPPVRKILADGNILYIYTNKRNENKEYLVDIIVLKTGKKINSAYFPVKLMKIKDGFGYRINGGRDVLWTVEKYKIDPLVYQEK